MMGRLASLALLVLACIVTPTLLVRGGILDDDAMPYDMSAVEEMERITQQEQQQQQQQADLAEVHVRSIALDPQLHDAMTDEEQAFFSEKDVDAFLEQRAHAESEQAARAEATARAHAEAEAAHQAALEAEAQHAALVQAQEKAHQLQMIRDTQAHAIEAANRAFDSHEAVSQSEQASEFQHGLEVLDQHQLENGQEQEFELDLDVGAETEGESEVESEDAIDTEAAAEAASEHASFVEQSAQQHVETQQKKPMTEVEQMRAAREHFAEVEAAGLKALRRVEFLAKVQQHDAAQKASDAQPVALAETQQQLKKDQVKPTTFLEARARSRSSSHASQPWWASQQGVTSNYHHYQQGVKNSLLKGQNGQVANAANSYALPLGKAVSASRLNQKKVPARAAGPVQAYPLIPVQQQGASLAFNPYSGSDFHPEIAVPAHAPKLPKYMAESTQPWAGAGYYGSGGGQGPHPGSEAFVPLPGVSGKEFGIRAREAWEAHAEQYKSDPTAFHNVNNLPEYPYFPSWSRESEIGGRPDLFPKPMFNLPTVNEHASLAAKNAYAHSQIFYPHLNNPIATPAPFVAAARAQAAVPVAGIRRSPRLIRQVVGYPRPTAPVSWAGTIPEQFPKPLNSNSFEEQHNYFDPNPVPTLAQPYHPLAGRNIMVNSGPDKGMHPIFGGYPAYIPVPVAAASPADVVA